MPLLPASFASAPRRRARIEIIPLIDVIFFLLATFVLFTLSLNKSGGLSVALPVATTGEPRDPTGAATISITADGTLAWDKQPVTLEEFIAHLQAYKQTSPNPRILLNGDENALFTRARYVIDEVRRAGIGKILVETRVAPPAP
jgi:biopolymer transport protein ExbD